MRSEDLIGIDPSMKNINNKNQTMEVKIKNVMNAYMKGDNNVKNVLRTIFPDINFEVKKPTKKQSVIERIKTFEDACRELGGDHSFVVTFDSYLDVHGAYMRDADVIAYLKLRIICATLNEGWEPKFAGDEHRWHPWSFLWPSEDIDKMSEEWKQGEHLIKVGDFFIEYVDFSDVLSSTKFPTHLCLKDRALAEYCGKQFIELWADLNLMHR